MPPNDPTSSPAPDPATVARDHLRVVARVCPGCEYSLRGLPEVGACPECGRPYTEATLTRWHRKQAMEGWTGMLLPPFASICFTLQSVAIGSEFGALVLLTLLAIIHVGCGVWAWQISRRLAAWQHFTKLEAAAAGDATEIPARYKKDLTIQLFLIELALMGAPLVICVGVWSLMW